MNFHKYLREESTLNVETILSKINQLGTSPSSDDAETNVMAYIESLKDSRFTFKDLSLIFNAAAKFTEGSYRQRLTTIAAFFNNIMDK